MAQSWLWDSQIALKKKRRKQSPCALHVLLYFMNTPLCYHSFERLIIIEVFIIFKTQDHFLRCMFLKQFSFFLQRVTDSYPDSNIFILVKYIFPILSCWFWFIDFYMYFVDYTISS